MFGPANKIVEMPEEQEPEENPMDALHERELALLLGKEKPTNKNEAQLFLAGKLFTEAHGPRGNIHLHEESMLWKNAVIEYWIKSRYSKALALYVASPEFKETGGDFSAITLEKVAEYKEELKPAA